MTDLETPFRTRARRLRSPTSVGFDETAWRAAYVDAGNKTDADQNLLQTAIWLANQSAAMRRDLTVPGLKELGGRLSVILAVATINREFNTTTDLSREATARASRQGALALDHLLAQPIAGGMPGNTGTAASFVEAAVDAAESCLFDACRETANGDPNRADLAMVAFRAARRYSLQHGLNEFWNHALWEGWYLRSEQSVLLWTPGDRQLATLTEAWRARQQANFMNYFGSYSVLC